MRIYEGGNIPWKGKMIPAGGSWGEATGVGDGANPNS
jgi:hypothetical protein